MTVLLHNEVMVEDDIRPKISEEDYDVLLEISRILPPQTSDSLVIVYASGTDTISFEGLEQKVCYVIHNSWILKPSFLKKASCIILDAKFIKSRFIDELLNILWRLK